MGRPADLGADGADRGPLAVHCAPHRGRYRHGPRPADGQLSHTFWRQTLCREDLGALDVARDGTGADRPYDRGTRRGRDHSGTWLDAGHRANRRHAFPGNQPGPETGLAPAGGPHDHAPFAYRSGRGSGKPLLLKHMKGLIGPQTGQVFLDSLEISRMEEDERTEGTKRVSMVF